MSSYYIRKSNEYWKLLLDALNNMALSHRYRTGYWTIKLDKTKAVLKKQQIVKRIKRRNTITLSINLTTSSEKRQK